MIQFQGLCELYCYEADIKNAENLLTDAQSNTNIKTDRNWQKGPYFFLFFLGVCIAVKENGEYFFFHKYILI